MVSLLNRKSIEAIFLCISLLQCSARADINWSGDILPYDPINMVDPRTWTNTAHVLIGNSAHGTIFLDAASELRTGSGQLGFGIGSSGEATVTGDGTYWDSSTIRVGTRGMGTLRVEAGGLVGSHISYLGDEAGSTGIATVTGVGSHWDSRASLYVGFEGNGTLTVEDGGLVTATTLYASIDDLHGNGTITSTEGAVLDANLRFDAAVGTLNTLLFGSGGTLNVSIDEESNGYLGVGYKTQGTLTISDGVSISSQRSYLGYHSGSLGEATVTGGAGWSSGRELNVGDKGNGVLLVEAGSRVYSQRGYIGNEVGATGSVTVTGEGAQWISRELNIGRYGQGTLTVEDGGLVTTDTLYVGRFGQGTLTVKDGGVVTTDTLYASRDDLFGDGIIEVGDSAIIDADLRFDRPYQTVSTSTFGSGGTLSVPATGGTLGLGYTGQGSVTVAEGMVLNRGGMLGYFAGSTGTATVTGTRTQWNGGFAIGFRGAGTLRVEDGARVNGDSGSMGTHDGATGTVIVTGAGSQWNNTGDLYVGRDGRGTLTVENGGLVTAGTLYASLDDLYGDGTITVSKGGILDADLRFDAVNGNHAIATFGSGGTLNVTIDGGMIGTGYRSRGSITIADGTVITSGGGSSDHGYLGYHAGSSGVATVTGFGSQWTELSTLYVGYYGNGTLQIEAGAKVISSKGEVGYGPGTAGSATVTGFGSAWYLSGALRVGGDGNGSVTVGTGARVTTETLFASLNDLHGNGTISTQNAILDADLRFDRANGRGSSYSFGSGGRLFVTSASVFGVGYRDSGSVSVVEGTVIRSGRVYLGYTAGSSGSATVSGSKSEWQIDEDAYLGGFGGGGGELYIGFFGNGILRIEAGGLVTSKYAFFGREQGSSGRAIVSGSGAEWRNSETLFIGNGGNYVGGISASYGSLLLEKSGRMSSRRAFLGSAPGTVGEAVINGANSLWIVGEHLTVGDEGIGKVRVNEGGSLQTSFAYLGYAANSVGTTAVIGKGSYWQNSGDLYVGNYGSGVLTISHGGLAIVGGSLLINLIEDGNSFINMSQGGMLALVGDADGSLSEFFDLIYGTDAINYWDDSLGDWAPLAHASYGVEYSLEYQSSGSLAGYTLLTVGTIPEPSAIVMVLLSMVAVATWRFTGFQLK